MKRFIIVLGLAAVAGLSNAQVLDPVKWTFTTKKIDAKTYEVHMVANIQMNWRLYSQTQPKDAIVNPTEIAFNKNPLVSFDGKVKENGKMES